MYQSLSPDTATFCKPSAYCCASDQEPSTASDLPVAGEPELGEFLALEEPPPPEQPANSEDDKVAEDDEAAGRLAWDKASDRIRSPLLRLHSGEYGLHSMHAARNVEQTTCCLRVVGTQFHSRPAKAGTACSLRSLRTCVHVQASGSVFSQSGQQSWEGVTSRCFLLPPHKRKTAIPIPAVLSRPPDCQGQACSTGTLLLPLPDK